jgi:hypothetical protein
MVFISIHDTASLSYQLSQILQNVFCSNAFAIPPARCHLCSCPSPLIRSQPSPPALSWSTLEHQLELGNGAAATTALRSCCHIGIAKRHHEKLSGFTPADDITSSDDAIEQEDLDGKSIAWLIFPSTLLIAGSSCRKEQAEGPLSTCSDIIPTHSSSPLGPSRL